MSTSRFLSTLNLVFVIIVKVNGELLFRRILETSAVSLAIIINGGAFHGFGNITDVSELLCALERNPCRASISRKLGMSSAEKHRLSRFIIIKFCMLCHMAFLLFQ